MPARDRIAVWRCSGDSALHRIHPPKRGGGRPLKILISAAEASSDVHGAQLLCALRRLDPTIEAFGIGGPKLQAEGLTALVDTRELLVMGLSEIFGRLPRIFRALGKLESESLARKPDVAVVIDYPDFHFRLARRLKRQKIPLVYYIPPKVWVWRKKRIRLLAELFERVLCIFPFEKKFFEANQLPVVYVGNPLLDELPLAMTRTDARAKLGVSEGETLLAVLAGSRPGELKRHLEPALSSAVRLAAHLRSEKKLVTPLRVIVPLPATADLQAIRARVQAWEKTGGWDQSSSIVRVEVTQGNSETCLRAADAAIVKSGTATLEAALLGCPQVVIYKTSWFTQWVFNTFIRYPGPFALVNLVAGRGPKSTVAKELLLGHVNEQEIATALREIFEPRYRDTQLGEYAKIRALLVEGGSGGSPSLKAAEEVLALARATPRTGG